MLTGKPKLYVIVGNPVLLNEHILYSKEGIVNIKTYPLDTRYEVSDDGRIFLKEHTVIRSNGSKMTYARKEKIRTVKEFGYEEVKVSVNNKTKHYKVHRMVAETFIPNPDNKPFINHKDGNKLNNHVSNLEWCTKEENQQHAERNNMVRDRRGYAVDVYDCNGYVATFASITKASKYLNLDRIIIGRIIDTNNKLKGFSFRSVSTSPRA